MSTIELTTDRPHWRDVPMPPAIAALPRDPRGFPVYHTVTPPDYEPGQAVDFRVINIVNHVHAGTHRLCAICALPLAYRFVFIGGPMCLANRVFGDGPLHHECAEYALHVCPYLINRSMLYQVDANPEVTARKVEERGMYTDQNVVRQRPERTLVYETRAYDLVPVPDGKPVFSAKAPTKITWLTSDARPLSPKQAAKTYVMCPAVNGILCLRCHQITRNAQAVAERRCAWCRITHEV